MFNSRNAALPKIVCSFRISRPTRARNFHSTSQNDNAASSTSASTTSAQPASLSTIAPGSLSLLHNLLGQKERSKLSRKSLNSPSPENPPRPSHADKQRARRAQKRLTRNSVGTVAVKADNDVVALKSRAKSDSALKESISSQVLVEENPTAAQPSDITTRVSPAVLTYSRCTEGHLQPCEGLSKMQDLAPPTEQRPIANLAHGLERVLFNPGVYWLQDPRSRVYNFSPWLQTIPKVQEFAFSRVNSFVKSSADNDLSVLAKQRNCRYTGSTSSLTGMLSQIYLLLSGERAVDLSTLSSAFAKEPATFTHSQKLPVSVKLYYHDGHYSTDSYAVHPGVTEKIVLTWMGTMLEKFLTLPEQDFRNLLHASEPPVIKDDGRREAFRYVQFGNYIMRSQLDCHDRRLPGTGIFDLKTRAAMSIRMDIMNYEHNSGYYIHKQHGLYESFEREYYDLIRSAFLKYSFQARIGNMDGVFIAYHNTARIFGFQYVPLQEMEKRLYGNQHAGPYVFTKCVELLEAINDEITYHFPKQSTSCLWEARPEEGVLSVWVEPASWAGLGEKPLVELEVRTKSFINGAPIKSHEFADHLPHKNWSVRYTIKTSSDDTHVINERRRGAETRLRQYFNLPQDTSVTEMAEVWQQMDFGGAGPEAIKAAFNPKSFKKAGPSIKKLRHLSKKGRETLVKLQQEDEGKEVVTLDDEANSVLSSTGVI